VTSSADNDEGRETVVRPIQVQVHGVNGSMPGLIATGYLSADEVFALLARVKGHPNARPTEAQPGSTAFEMGGLLLLPDGMKTVSEGPYPQFDYTFGLVPAEDPGRPDYYETGEVAFKLVPGPVTEAQLYYVGAQLADAADINGCGAPDVYRDWLYYGMTLVTVVRWRPM
jgi:hypothetical protein